MRLFLPLLALLCAAPAAAQTITGTVYDPSGAVVAGARVMLMDDYVKVGETKSDAAGRFTFDGLQRKLYHVQVKQPRFALYQSHANLVEQSTARLFAVLPLAHMSEVLVIRGQGVAPAATRPPAASGAPCAGGQVQPARLVHRVPPAYPAEAKQRGASGAVAIYGWITTDGALSNPIVLSSDDAALETAALDAVKQWRYEPMRLNGTPVSCEATIVLEFGGE
jgi:TonB family protein